MNRKMLLINASEGPKRLNFKRRQVVRRWGYRVTQITSERIEAGTISIPGLGTRNTIPKLLRIPTKTVPIKERDRSKIVA